MNDLVLLSQSAITVAVILLIIIAFSVNDLVLLTKSAIAIVVILLIIIALAELP